MSVFKCKMCGGTIEFEQGATVGVCDSCGTKQTLPKLDDDRRANLYDRANHFRRNNEFDKAAGIYEQILNEDGTDAEAYWSLVLCRYGIEYVEDPVTKRRVPTVNRAQYTSIFDDDNYKSALQYADISQKLLYEEEAKQINEIQKGILAISQKEEPFDVFICYKETDNNGRRTPDSVLANDLYHQLTQEGFKVFFARITLEDKLGTAYEPYIFAALNSAKVMVALGTKPEYFNAVWVKNEWSRYLALVKQSGGKKVLIPAYKDMDPYDLPEEFSHLQAQDMGKLGFMQDLIRGIKKLTQADAPKQTTVKETVITNGAAGANGTTRALLDRGFLALEDGEWEKADGFFEQALNFDAKIAEAYLGKLMAELKVKKRGDFASLRDPFEDRNNYQKALRFGDEKLKEEVRGYALTARYNAAAMKMNAASTETNFRAAQAAFREISGFRDADGLALKCGERAEGIRKDAIWRSASVKYDSCVVSEIRNAIEMYKRIPGWRDADAKIGACEKRIAEILAKEERERQERARREEETRRRWEEERIAGQKAAALARKKAKRTTAIVIVLAVIMAAGWYVYSNVIVPQREYSAAVALYDSGKYEEAITAFSALNGFKDSESLIERCYIGKYGQTLYNTIKNTNVGSIYRFGHYEQDNNASNGTEEIEWIVLDKQGTKLLLISRYALDCQPYNKERKNVTWETCTLRPWLNSTFPNAAFSAAEQKRIVQTTVQNPDNSRYGTKGGNATQDRVFLLSIDEANKYFKSDDARACAGTAYAYAQGASKSKENGNCWWWLRSPGVSQDDAARVGSDGSVNDYGNYVFIDDRAVRPAFWIDLAS